MSLQPVSAAFQVLPGDIVVPQRGGRERIIIAINKTTVWYHHPGEGNKRTMSRRGWSRWCRDYAAIVVSKHAPKQLAERARNHADQASTGDAMSDYYQGYIAAINHVGAILANRPGQTHPHDVILVHEIRKLLS